MIRACKFQYYGKFAVHMTDWENYKTQLEYENTLTIRRYVFEVFNFYSSLVYIGFFKGKLVLQSCLNDLVG